MRDTFKPGPEQSELVEQTQTDTRSKRVDRLRAMVQELFEGEEKRELREQIEISFQVPQIGEHHTEGMFMDSHLDLFFPNIERVKNGEFPEELSQATKDVLSRAVTRNAKTVHRYVFEHDISKKDCLTVKFGETERIMTWDEWQALLSATESGRKAQTGDEEALRQFSREQGITGVSYYQAGEGEGGKRAHGKVGADYLRTSKGEEDEAVLGAIEAHEVAYSFERIKVDTYEKYFSGMTDDVRDFAMLASFVDTMSSYSPDGKPDLTNFLALAGSREKYESLLVIGKRLEGVALDKQKYQRAWSALRGSSEPVTVEMIDETAQKLLKECRLAGYDLERLQQLSESLVTDGTLTAEERDRLLQIAKDEPQTIGKVFGPKMRMLRPILDQSKT